MKKTLLTGFVMAGFAVSAHAAPGMYATVAAGKGGMDTKNYSNNSNPFSNVSLRDGTAYRIAVGYLMGDDFNYGIELGYTGYPKNIYKNSTWNLKDTYTGSTTDLLGVGKYNFNSGFFIVGKAGVARVSQKVNGQFEGMSAFNKTDHLKPEAALGVGYNITNAIGLDATFSHIFGSQADPAGTNSAATKTASVSTLMAGISYNFS